MLVSIRHGSIALLLSVLWSQLLYSRAWVLLPGVPVPPPPTTAKPSASFATAPFLSAARRHPQRQHHIFFSTKTDGVEKDKSPDSEISTSTTTTTTTTIDSNNATTTTTATGNSTATAEKEKVDDEEEEDDDDDDDEYEYIEYDILTEAEYMGSEWLVGTCFDSNSNSIQETWVRLTEKGDKNIAIWGDNSEGKWSLDVASQFLAISKEYKWGKQIWAGVVDDYYYVQGTVRGWTFVTPASVIGQWQAKRLGVDPDEAGTPPWFQVEEEEEDDDDDERSQEEEERDAPTTATASNE